MNSLRKLRLDLPTSDDGSPAKEKRKVKRLYVEADEDHLSGNRNKAEAVRAEACIRS